MVEENIWT